MIYPQGGSTSQISFGYDDADRRTDNWLNSNATNTTWSAGFPPRLALTGPTQTFEYSPLPREFPIPATARLNRDGSCQSVMQVTVPYKPRYRAGVAIEGRGITQPTDPSNAPISTEGDSQAITVLR